MIIAKERIANGRKLVAVCDGELLGKCFEENGLQIDLTGEFYKGEEADENKLIKMLDGTSSANFVGKESVDFGLRNGVLEKENVKTISGIPHAHSFAM